MTTTELISELESDLQDTVDWEWKGLVDFNAGKTQLVCMTGQITLVLLIGVTFFSSKLDQGPYIVSISKTASRKIGVLICSMKFRFPKVSFYLY